MSLFTSTKVELSPEILEFIHNGLDMNEKCVTLEDDLKQVCPSISLTEYQGKLILSGSWEDIVKIQETLNKWMDYRKTKKHYIAPLASFIQGRNSPKLTFSEPSTRQGEAQAIFAPSLAPVRAPCVAPAAADDLSDGITSQCIATDKHENTIIITPSTRPKRNVKHKILPLLKRSGKHFNLDSSSEEDEKPDDKILASYAAVYESCAKEEKHEKETQIADKVRNAEDMSGKSAQNNSTSCFELQLGTNFEFDSPTMTTRGIHERPMGTTSGDQVGTIAMDESVSCATGTNVYEIEDSDISDMNGNNDVPIHILGKSMTPNMEMSGQMEDFTAVEKNLVQLTNTELGVQDTDAEATIAHLTGNTVTKAENVKPVNTHKKAVQVKRSDPELHRLIVKTGDNYSCYKCDYKSDVLTNIKLHIMRSHLPKPFICCYCDKSYGLRKDLNAHMAVHTRPHPCSDCSLSFSKAYLLRRHKQTLHEGTPKKRGCKPKPKKSKIPEEHGCDLCEFSTPNKRGLLSHLQRMHSQKNFSCPQCVKTFGLAKDLTLHIQRIHSTSNECPICQKLLKDKYSLQMHIKVIHERIKLPQSKSYQCHLCGNVCKNKTQYTVHMNKQHLNHRPFKCETCGMSFFAKANLSAHHLIHSDERRFACSVCGKKFKQRQGLRVHKNTHKSAEDRPFKCDTCHAVFTQQGALIRHTRIHSGIRPYVCKYSPETCSVAFNDYSVLRRHLRGIHKVCDPDELRRMVQKACDECREMIQDAKNKDVADAEDSHKYDKLLERNRVTYAQQLQSRKLKETKKNVEKKVTVKLEKDGSLTSPDIQIMTQLQRVCGVPAQLNVVMHADNPNAAETHHLHNLVSQLAAKSQIASPGHDEEPVVQMVYVNEDGSVTEVTQSDMKIEEKICVPRNKERTPETLEEAVKEALQEEQMQVQVDEEELHIQQVALPQTLDLSHSAIQLPDGNIIAANQEIVSLVSSDHDSGENAVTLQPVVSIQNLLQADAVPHVQYQMAALQNMSQVESLESVQQCSFLQSDLPSNMMMQKDINTNELQQVAIMSHGDDSVAEHIIVITNLPDDKHANINNMVPLHQQRPFRTDINDVDSADVTQNVGPQTTALSYDEAANVLGLLIPQIQNQHNVQ